MKKPVLLALTDETYECLKENARLYGLSMSRLVRDALEEYYRKREGSKMPTMPENTATIQPIDYTEEGV